MRLPQPGQRYDAARESQRNRLLEDADRRNLKIDTDTVMSGGRIILVAPDGSKWALKVSNSGILTTEAVT